MEFQIVHSVGCRTPTWRAPAPIPSTPDRNPAQLGADAPQTRVPLCFGQKIVRTSFEHFLSHKPLIFTLFPKAEPAFNGGSK